MTINRVHTFCRLCDPHCGLLAEVEDGRILALRNDKDHPVHKGFSCHKGIQYLRVHQDPDRLNHPLRRCNSRSEDRGDFARVSWDEAATEIGTQLNDITRRHGNKAIAVYTGNPANYSNHFVTNAHALFAGFGEGARFSALTQDCANKFAGSEAMYGSFLVHPIPDLLHTDYFLSIGSNPAISHMSLVQVSDPMAKLRAIKQRGGKIVFVNPRQIESATPETGDVIQIKPDTDFYLLAGLLHEIIFSIGYDCRRVEKHAKNLDGLIEFVKDWPVERAAAVTDIAVDAIREIARDFCAAPAASIYMSTGVNMGSQGLLADWMLQMISLVSGNLGKRGGNLYSPGFCPKAKFTKRTQDQPFFDSEFGEMRTVAGNLPTNLMVEMLESQRNPVKALIVISGNPLLSVGGEARLRKALQDLELVVVLDIYRSATAELADYVLPVTDFLEREDVNTLIAGHQLEPYVQYTPAVVPPKGERRDDWWILSRLLQAMGKPSLLDDPQPKPFAAVEAMLQYSGLSLDKLKGLPCQTAILTEADPEAIFQLGVQNDDGLIDCCPQFFSRGYISAEQRWQTLIAEPKDQLKLITRRTGLMINSWMNNLSVHKKSVHMTNPLWMNPQDAQSRGLFGGSEVRVQTDFGQVQAELVLDETLRPGVVAMSHGWGQSKAYGLTTANRFPGVNVNQLAPVGPGSFDVLSNQAHLTGVDVKVTAGSVVD
jgi:anaerobic selenocysteine-containing dehydrogenase